LTTIAQAGMSTVPPLVSVWVVQTVTNHSLLPSISAMCVASPLAVIAFPVDAETVAVRADPAAPVIVTVGVSFVASAAASGSVCWSGCSRADDHLSSGPLDRGLQRV
jgi:hypothetical protein